MARAFRATTNGYRAELESHERRLVSQLCADVILMLRRRGDDFQPAQEEPAADDEFAHFRRELAGLGEETPVSPEAHTPEVSAPEDAVVARLLPSGWEDPQEAADFRRLTEGSLRESKIADLQAARLLLDREVLVLNEDQAPVFGRALNDVRLTLAVRLGIDDGEDAAEVHTAARQRAAETTEQFMGEVYAFTTWLQESLFSAMLDVLPDSQ